MIMKFCVGDKVVLDYGDEKLFNFTRTQLPPVMVITEVFELKAMCVWFDNRLKIHQFPFYHDSLRKV